MFLKSRSWFCRKTFIGCIFFLRNKLFKKITHKFNLKKKKTKDKKKSTFLTSVKSVEFSSRFLPVPKLELYASSQFQNYNNTQVRYKCLGVNITLSGDVQI